MKTNAGGLIWITGYSCTGKTTLARKVQQLMVAQHMTCIMLDGDDLRNIFGNSWAFDKRSRIDLAKIYIKLCSHLVAQNIVVIISAVAMFGEIFDWMRDNIPNSFLVHLNVPKDIREKRNELSKKLSNFNEVDNSIYDDPVCSDLVIDNFGATSPNDASALILSEFKKSSKVDADRGREKHWNKFYAAVIAPDVPTQYARDVLSKIEPGGRLLEVGSGNGRDAYFFHSNGFKVAAIDMAENAILYSKKRYLNEEIEFYNGSILEFARVHDGVNFDVIYSRFVFHAMTLIDELSTINKCYEILANRGKLFIECRSINDPLARKGEVISPTERIFGHYRRFIILEELLARLESAKFEIIEFVESTGLASFLDEDPVVIRVIAQK